MRTSFYTYITYMYIFGKCSSNEFNKYHIFSYMFFFLILNIRICLLYLHISIGFGMYIHAHKIYVYNISINYIQVKFNDKYILYIVDIGLHHINMTDRLPLCVIYKLHTNEK